MEVAGEAVKLGAAGTHRRLEDIAIRHNSDAELALETDSRAMQGIKPLKKLAPQVGLEPTTLRLTAGCSAIELLRSGGRDPFVDIHNIIGGALDVAGALTFFIS